MAYPQWVPRIGSQDSDVINEVVHSNTYNLPRRLHGIVAIDIGAHIGTFTAACLERGAVHVYAYEADAGNYAMAAKHLAGYADRVTLEHLAVVRSDIPPRFVYMPSGYSRFKGSTMTGGNNVLDEPPRGSYQTIKTIAFDEVLAQARDQYPGADIWLKEDCEGGEFGHLLSSSKLGEVTRIVAEGHEQPAPLVIYGSVFPCTRQALVEHLGEWDFICDIVEYEPKDPALFRFFAAPKGG